MELYEPSSFNQVSPTFPPDIPQFCASLEDTYQEVCYDTAGVHAYGRLPDMRQAVATCEEVPEVFRKPCISALGQDIFFVKNGAVSEIISLCTEAAPYASACVSGALEASITSDPHARHAPEICNALNRKEKDLCYALLKEKLMSLYGMERTQTYCGLFPEEYDGKCRSKE